jgi:hypothetical protein
MLKRIKDSVEKRINRQISMQELRNAIKDSTANIISNYLLLGHDVTAKEFLDVLINCINVKKNSKESNTDSVLTTIVDQGGQLKSIIRATILDYNRTTVFGITPENKRTWLGKYNTPEEAEKVRNHINRKISEETVETVYISEM